MNLFWIGCLVILTKIFQIHCECLIHFANDIERRPILKKTLGTKFKINIPAPDRSFQLREWESMELECHTGFESINSPYSYTKKYIGSPSLATCRDDTIFLNHNTQVANDEVIKCKNFDMQLYERELPWCSSEENSYILTTNLIDNESDIVASLCTDLMNQRFGSFQYSTGSHRKPFSRRIVKTPDIYTDHLISSDDKSLSEIDKNLMKSLFRRKMSLSVHQGPYGSRFYNRASIAQGNVYDAFFNNLSPLLDIWWWPELLEGIWQQFIQALDERSKFVNYDVNLGTGGQVRGKSWMVPINETIPAFVWAHLKSVESEEKEDFVVIGYNTPFPDEIGEPCKSVCHKYSWLDRIQDPTNWRSSGRLICCDTNEIHNPDLLGSFSFIKKAIAASSEPIY